MDYNNSFEDNFEFSILEIINNDDFLVRQREEYFISLYLNKDCCYNKNPFANKPYLSSSILEQQSKNRTERNIIVRDYFNQIRNNKIIIDDIPKTYRKQVNHWLNRIVWNKGLTKENINYDFLKGVKKTQTEEWRKSKITNGILNRSNSQPVEVYDYKGQFLMTFRSISDIVDYSKFKYHDLPLILRVPQGRNARNHTGKHFVYLLANQNIGKVCKGIKKHHKGLIFRYTNSNIPVIPLIPQDIHPTRNKFTNFWFKNELLLSEEILIEKRNNIGEVLRERDNTEIICINKEIQTS